MSAFKSQKHGQFESTSEDSRFDIRVHVNLNLFPLFTLRLTMSHKTFSYTLSSISP